MPGALCVLNAFNTSVGRCNFLPLRGPPDLNLSFRYKFFVNCIVLCNSPLRKSRASKCALNKAAPSVTFADQTQISSDI
jgi:hypothetical protein